MSNPRKIRLINFRYESPSNLIGDPMLIARFDNDRFAAVVIKAPYDKEAVARALFQLGERIREDPHLDPATEPAAKAAHDEAVSRLRNLSPRSQTRAD